MTFVADCGSSTMLEELCVTRTVGSLVRGEGRATCDTLAPVHHRAYLGHGVALRAKPEGRE